MHCGEEYDSGLNRRLWWGVAGWVLFCVVAVLLRGIRWDETYEHALMITRLAPYPEGHPFYRYVRNIFSLQSYLSAAWLAALPSPALLCGLRNFLELTAGIVPVFLLGGLLTRKALGGHIAAVLVLLEVHKPFQSYYPIEVWPHFYSVGPIGMGYALLILGLFIAGTWRIPWFLLGLMPAVHLGQFPPIAFVALGVFLMRWRPDRRADCLKAILWGGAGLLGCGAFWIVLRYFHVPPPEGGPYAAQSDPWPIWSAYSALHDVHRFFPRYGAFEPPLILAFMLLLIVGGLIWNRFLVAPNSNSENDIYDDTFLSLRIGIRSYSPIGLYAGAALAAVLVIFGIHSWLGANIPFLLIGWMPYRLLNHLPVLLIAVVLATLSLKRKNEASSAYGDWLILLLLLCAAVLPLVHLILPESIVTRYFSTTDSLLFALMGGSVAAIWLELRSSGHYEDKIDREGEAPAEPSNTIRLFSFTARQEPRPPIFPSFPRSSSPESIPSFPSCTWERTCPQSFTLWTISMLAAFVALAWYHQFGAVCFVVGAGVVFASSLIPLNLKRFGTYAICMLLVIITGSLLAREAHSRSSLPMAPIQRDIVQYLDAQGVPNTLLVTPYWDIEWLSHTRHPIMADYQTAHLMTYLPDLAPSIQKLYRGVYGIEVDAPQPWNLDAWPKRSPEEWRRLGQEYHFSYVVSPREYPLTLEPVVTKDQHTMYRISPK